MSISQTCTCVNGQFGKGRNPLLIDTIFNGLYNRTQEVGSIDTIIAVYEQGVLRPLSSLALAENIRVRLQIIEQVADPDTGYPLLMLANLGESRENDVSERAEEILFAEASQQDR